jgi:hypothetical protein
MTIMYSSARCVPVVVLALAAASCDVRVGEQGVSVEMVEGRATDEWVRTYTLAPGGQLEIINANGIIEAFPAAGSQVEVRAKRDVRGRSEEAAQALLKQVTIAEEVAPDRVKVETGEPQYNGFRQGISVTYRVSVPPGLTVSLRSQNGGVRLENVDGRFTASSTNGVITGRGVSGSLDASTVNGGINVELASVSGDVRMTTVNGGIRLEARPGLNATLEASAVNGGVMVRDGFPLQFTEREPRRVAGRINNGGSKIVLRTTNGGIVVGAGRGRRAPETIERELQAR